MTKQAIDKIKARGAKEAIRDALNVQLDDIRIFASNAKVSSANKRKEIEKLKASLDNAKTLLTELESMQ